MSSPLIMTDKDVAELIGVSVRTLRRRLAEPKAGEIDIAKEAGPSLFGRRRIWLRPRVEKALGIKS